MSKSHKEFAKRVKRINRRHLSMSRGYELHLGGDGLIVAKPRKSGFRLPILPVLLLVGIFFGFKALLLGSLGLEDYESRVADLREGTSLERAGAMVMAVDPISLALASAVNPGAR